jgi:cytosine/adenosine deaminase-related metal-dependent hydrolase
MLPMGMLLQNGLVITQNPQREIINTDILIEQDQIVNIGKNIPSDNHETYDCRNLVLMPGFIQSHIHLCQTIFRNLAEDLELLDWLENRIWPWEAAHSEESLQASAQLGLAELMLGGTTSILDMGNGNHQEIIFEEMEESGIRGLSGMVMMDSGKQEYKKPTETVLETTEKLINKWHDTSNGRIHYAIAPRFVLSCSPQLWDGVKKLSRKYDLIIHSHSSENKTEWEIVKDKTGYSNIQFFLESGLASPKLCLAHCIWVSDTEIDIISQYGVNVLHCPSANLKLGSGIAPIPKFLERGINVSLGSDGAPCNNNLNIFQEMRLAALIQKPTSGITSMSAKSVFDMATLGGAKAIGLEDKIGSIEVGKKADLALMDLNKVHCIPADDIYSQIVYSANTSNVKHVMIDGKWVVFNQELIHYSEEKILNNTWNHIQTLFNTGKQNVSN